MRDRYLEILISDEVEAQHEVDMLHEEYLEVGMYPCNGGFLVYADRESERI